MNASDTKHQTRFNVLLLIFDHFYEKTVMWFMWGNILLEICIKI